MNARGAGLRPRRGEKWRIGVGCCWGVEIGIGTVAGHTADRPQQLHFHGDDAGFVGRVMILGPNWPPMLTQGMMRGILIMRIEKDASHYGVVVVVVAAIMVVVLVVVVAAAVVG